MTLLRRPFSRLLAASLGALVCAGCAQTPNPDANRAASRPDVAMGAVPLPYSAAVAARFPDPALPYRTPAFEPGRGDYTRNPEVQAWLHDVAQRGGPAQVRLLPLGTSQAGVPLEALLFTRLARTEPADVVQSGRPTVLLVGQQHGDEPAGSEALLVVAQRLVQGELQGLLERINVLVLPRANPDGAAVSRRVTNNGIDANRDHLLLKTPEARAQAQLVRDYRPAVVVDAHEYSVVGRFTQKFGAIQRYDALLQYATTANLPSALTQAAEQWFREPLVAALNREGLSSEWYYTTSADIADKKISMGGTQPDTARNVNGLKNAISLLVETRGVGIGKLHLQRRVHTQVTAIKSVLRSAAERAEPLVQLRRRIDAEVSAQACRGEAVVEAGPTPMRYPLLMLDPVTGADRSIRVDWDSALTLVPSKTRARPCGYWLDAQAQDAVSRLRDLGVRVLQVAQGGALQAETYRETGRSSGARQDVRGAIADAESIVRVQVSVEAEPLTAGAGSYYVPLDQPLANLVVAALEPDTQNSYLANRLVAAVGQVARVMQPPPASMLAMP